MSIGMGSLAYSFMRWRRGLQLESQCHKRRETGTVWGQLSSSPLAVLDMAVMTAHRLNKLAKQADSIIQGLDFTVSHSCICPPR